MQLSEGVDAASFASIESMEDKVDPGTPVILIFGPSYSDATGLREVQGEHPCVGQATPQTPFHATVSLQRADGCHRVRAGAEPPHRLLQGLLVLGDIEVHRQRSRGRPRTRSPRMLRWIWDVPAAIESEMAWTQPCTWSPLRARPRSSKESADRSRIRMARSPSR